MKNVTVGGRAYNLQMNMLAAIGYAKATGKEVVDLEQFAQSSEAQMLLAYSMIIATKQPTDEPVPDMEAFMASITTSKEFADLNKAASDEIIAFYDLGKLMAKQTKKGAKPKNA